MSLRNDPHDGDDSDHSHEPNGRTLRHALKKRGAKPKEFREPTTCKHFQVATSNHISPCAFFSSSRSESSSGEASELLDLPGKTHPEKEGARKNETCSRLASFFGPKKPIPQHAGGSPCVLTRKSKQRKDCRRGHQPWPSSLCMATRALQRVPSCYSIARQVLRSFSVCLLHTTGLPLRVCVCVTCSCVCLAVDEHLIETNYAKAFLICLPACTHHLPGGKANGKSGSLSMTRQTPPVAIQTGGGFSKWWTPFQSDFYLETRKNRPMVSGFPLRCFVHEPPAKP